MEGLDDSDGERRSDGGQDATDDSMAALLAVYSAIRTQILDTKASRTRFYQWKLVAIAALLSFSAQTSQQDNQIAALVAALLTPVVAYLIDEHAKSRSQAIERDGQYLQDNVEPLLKGAIDKRFGTTSFVPPEAFYRRGGVDYTQAAQRITETDAQRRLTQMSVGAAVVLSSYYAFQLASG